MTLVSVIGDFFSSVVPVFYEFKDKIDTHIIISDDSKRDDRLAGKFEKGLKKFIDKYNLNIKTLYYSIDQDSFESLERAKEFKHSLNDELALLFIHGTLHLLGYDHEIDNGEMREKEKEIIKKFNLPESLIVRVES